MPFHDLMNDRLTLIKKDGTTLKSDIPASVSSKGITTLNADFPLEVGDVFVRTIPTGMVENFVVTDPGYHNAFHGIQAHYQCKVRRGDAPSSPPRFSANFYGANSRINLNSTDQSINVASPGIQLDELAGLVEQLRASIPALPLDQQQGMEPHLTVLEAEVGNSTPSQTKIRSALESIRAVAEGATGNIIAAGVISVISKLLGA